MKLAFKQVVPFFNHVMSKLDVADLGRWKLPLRIFFLLGIALAVVEAGGWFGAFKSVGKVGCIRQGGTQALGRWDEGVCGRMCPDCPVEFVHG